jgi:hypothetical protein
MFKPQNNNSENLLSPWFTFGRFHLALINIIPDASSFIVVRRKRKEKKEI